MKRHESRWEIDGGRQRGWGECKSGEVMGGVHMTRVHDSHVWECHNKNYSSIELIFSNWIGNKVFPQEETHDPKPRTYNSSSQGLNGRIMMDLWPTWVTEWDHVSKKQQQQQKMNMVKIWRKGGCKFNRWRVRKNPFHCGSDIVSLVWLRVYNVRHKREAKIQSVLQNGEHPCRLSSQGQKQVDPRVQSQPGLLHGLCSQLAKAA